MLACTFPGPARPQLQARGHSSILASIFWTGVYVGDGGLLLSVACAAPFLRHPKPAPGSCYVPTKPSAPLLKLCHWGSIPWLPLSLSPNIPYQASPEEETHSAGSPDPFGNHEKIVETGGLREGWATEAFLAAGCVCWLHSWGSAGQRS